MLDLFGVDGEATRVEAARCWPFTHPADAWIEGAGMDPTLLDGLRPLTALHCSSPKRAKVLASVDGKSAFVDGAALQAAGLNPSPDPPGGHIDPAAQGTPTRTQARPCARARGHTTEPDGGPARKRLRPARCGITQNRLTNSPLPKRDNGKGRHSAHRPRALGALNVEDVQSAPLRLSMSRAPQRGGGLWRADSETPRVSSWNSANFARSSRTQPRVQRMEQALKASGLSPRTILV